MYRRKFIGQGILVASGAALLPKYTLAETAHNLKPSFKVSIAPWSLMRTPYGQPDSLGIDLFDYPMIAKELGFDAVEQDNLHFEGDLPKESLIVRMKKRCEEANIKNTLILCGALGDIADVSQNKRNEANNSYERWIEAAEFLGCHQVRVVCADHITIPREEKMKITVDAVARLADFSANHNIELLIENHNGYSSDPDWLVEMITKVNRSNCGILGDFTEWRMERNPDVLYPDPYRGYEILAPLVRSVGAKSTSFDDMGNELITNYPRMFEILAKVGFEGYVAVEYFGEDLPREEGVKMTKDLVDRIIAGYN